MPNAGVFTCDGNNIKGDDVITDREIVESYIPIAKFIAEMSGPRCEVAVHDLADIDHSIIAIENGYLTGRKIGDSLLDFDVHKMFEPEYMRQPYLVNYTGKNTVGDRVFRFSTFYIRNATGYVIGLLNTNVDISNLLALQNAVSKELLMNTDDEPERSMPGPQALAISADSLINSNFEEAMGTYGYTDPAALSKNEKLNIIAYLCERNTFALKGAVGIVAKKLCVSEPTAYRYLRSLRSHMPYAAQTETSSD